MRVIYVLIVISMMFIYGRQICMVLNPLNKNMYHRVTCTLLNNRQNRNLCTCKFKYCNEIEKAINEQITCEQQASQEYLAFATHFGHPNIARPGCYKFFMSMYDEEIGHMQALIKYQLIRGGVVCLGTLKQPHYDKCMTMCDALKKALLMERAVTQNLENIVILSEQKKDYQSADFITSRFLSEQMESIHKMAKLVTLVEQLNVDVCALLLFDCNLEKIIKNYNLSMPDSI